MRWYEVDKIPGTYQLGDYSSSDWDDDPKSYDPPLGEESVTRQPNNDFRPCCPPPWTFPELDGCVNAAGPQFTYYHLPALDFSFDSYPSLHMAPQILTSLGGCVWQGPAVSVPPHAYVLTMSILPGGVIEVDALITIFGVAHFGVVWRSDGAVDPGGPFSLTISSSSATGVRSPDSVRLTGSGVDVLGTDACIGIGTEAGVWIAL